MTVSDYIRKADAIEAVCGVVIDEFNVSPTWGYEVAEKALSALPPANMKNWNGLSITVYDDDDPQDKAEKMYQICADIEELAEVARCIQGYCDIPSAEAVQGWIPCDGKLPNTVGDHVLVTIKWADDDLEVCEMCPASASRYNIVAYQNMPTPYKGGDDE